MLVVALLIAAVFAQEPTCDDYAAACMADVNCATRNAIVGTVIASLPIAPFRTGDPQLGEFSYLDFSMLNPYFHSAQACFMFDLTNYQFDPTFMMAISCYANLAGFANTVTAAGIVDMMLGADEDGNPIPLCGCHNIAAACTGDTTEGGCLEKMDSADKCGMSEGAPNSMGMLEMEDPYWPSGPRKVLMMAAFDKDDWCAVGDCYQQEADPLLSAAAYCFMDKLGGDFQYCIDKVMAKIMLIIILSNVGSVVGTGLTAAGVWYFCLRNKKN